MADIKLGPNGTETTLPQISWSAGSPPGMPVNHVKIMNSSTQSDGSMRVGIIAVKREWTLTWHYLTDAEVATLAGLHALTVPLRFQNNWESSTWYSVAILSFKADPRLDSYHRAVHRNSAVMVIREL